MYYWRKKSFFKIRFWAGLRVILSDQSQAFQSWIKQRTRVLYTWDKTIGNWASRSLKEIVNVFFPFFLDKVKIAGEGGRKYRFFFSVEDIKRSKWRGRAFLSDFVHKKFSIEDTKHSNWQGRTSSSSFEHKKYFQLRT